MRRSLAASGVSLLLFMTIGCGPENADITKNLRPPVALDLSGVITSRGKLHVGPRRFGAGPIGLVLSHQGRVATRVELVGPGVVRTVQLEPGRTETLNATLRPGRYHVRAISSEGTQSVVLFVGPLRSSPQNRVDLP